MEHRRSRYEESHRKRHRRDEEVPKSFRAAERNPSPLVDSWDGLLTLNDDIEFDLTFDWDPFRSSIAKMLFGRGGFLNGDRSTQEDFWIFFARLRGTFERQLEREGESPYFF
jgi:hypothetical protein